jgi:hypothetical protein
VCAIAKSIDAHCGSPSSSLTLEEGTDAVAKAPLWQINKKEAIRPSQAILLLSTTLRVVKEGTP